MTTCSAPVGATSRVQDSDPGKPSDASESLSKAVLSGDEAPSRPPDECAIVARLPQSRSREQVRPLLLADEISGNLPRIKSNYIFYTLGTTCEEGWKLMLENTRSFGV